MRAPALRHVTRMVRQANDAWEGGEFCALSYTADELDCWSIDVFDSRSVVSVQFGREWIPGDGAPLDAVAVARRLLAAFVEGRASQPSKGSVK